MKLHGIALWAFVVGAFFASCAMEEGVVYVQSLAEAIQPDTRISTFFKQLDNFQLDVIKKSNLSFSEKQNCMLHPKSGNTPLMQILAVLEETIFEGDFTKQKDISDIFVHYMEQNTDSLPELCTKNCKGETLEDIKSRIKVRKNPYPEDTPRDPIEDVTIVKGDASDKERVGFGKEKKEPKKASLAPSKSVFSMQLFKPTRSHSEKTVKELKELEEERETLIKTSRMKAIVSPVLVRWAEVESIRHQVGKSFEQYSLEKKTTELEKEYSKPIGNKQRIPKEEYEKLIQKDPSIKYERKPLLIDIKRHD